METQGKRRGPARKDDDESVRRGHRHWYSRAQGKRIDQHRGGISRTVWIRIAIEARLQSPNLTSDLTTEWKGPSDGTVKLRATEVKVESISAEGVEQSEIIELDSLEDKLKQ